MYIVRLTCNHCDTENVVAECKCGKAYVITTAHIEGRLRDEMAGSVGHMQAILVGHTCDACIAQYFGGVEDAVERQRTCPACHKEFLS